MPSETADIVTETVRVTGYEPTYRAHLEPAGRGGLRAITDGEPCSYFRDLIAVQRSGDRDALERLERHGREIAGEFRGGAELPGVVYGDAEGRAPTASYATPPLWLIEYFATAPRPHRVLADLAPSFRLPEGVGAVYLPRETEPISEGTSDPGADVTDADDSDAYAYSPVAPVAGQWDVPLQLLEQSPPSAAFDWVAFTALQADYDYQLERQMIAGSGTWNEIQGLLTNPAVPSSHQITYTSGTPSATQLYAYLGQAVAVIGDDRLLPPEIWLMRTSRFAWLASSEDAQNRPLVIANTGGSGEFDLLSISVRQDNAIPVSGGSDVIIACRPSDWLLLESDTRTDVMMEPLSGVLGVRLQLRGYAAALLRYPSSVAWVQGSGLTVPTGF